MDLFNNLIFGFSVALSLQNLFYCFVGVLVGTLIGVLPGIGPLGTIAILLPITYSVSAGRGDDHARRHLLRRAIRRLDHGHPGEPARRNLVGGDLHRRLPDGAAGPRRPGARDRRHRLVLRRHRRHAAHCAVWAAARRHRAEIRRAGIFLADADGPRRRRRAGAGRHGEIDRDGGDRPAARHRRHRRQHRHAALQLRHLRTDRRHRLHRGGGRRVRGRRDRQQSRREPRAPRALRQGVGPVPDLGRT